MNRLLALEVQQPNLVGAFQRGRQAKQQNNLMSMQLDNAGLQNTALRAEPEQRKQAIMQKAEMNLMGHLSETLALTNDPAEKAKIYAMGVQMGDRIGLDMEDVQREYSPEVEQFLRVEAGSMGFKFKEPKAAQPTNIEKLLNAKRQAEAAGDTQRVQVLDNAIQKATAPSKGVNVTTNVDTAGNSFNKEFGKQNARDFFERRTLAVDAAKSIQAITETRRLVAQGINTGTAAEFRNSIGRLIQTVGFNESSDVTANTDAFLAAQAGQVANIIQAFGAGTGLSDADREFAINAAGGNIKFSENAIIRILGMNEKAAKHVVNSFNEDANSIDKNLSPFDLSVPLSEQSMLPQGVTEDDITTTMGIHNMTREQVLEGLSNARR